LSEAEQAIKKLKSYEVPGMDLMHAELVKYADAE
jgi:hypothetical protein